ncbi:cadherin repeat domain-containing protein, partial [Photobacterium aphoticum]
AVVTVNVTPVNDAPEFLSGTDTPTDAPKDDVYNFDAVKEGSKSGALVGTVKAVVADGDTLSSSFVGGELTNGVFSIDPTSGAITLNQDIDDADLGEFDLAVEVRDGNGGVATATVKVELGDVTGAPEVLSVEVR